MGMTTRCHGAGGFNETADGGDPGAHRSGGNLQSPQLTRRREADGPGLLVPYMCLERIFSDWNIHAPELLQNHGLLEFLLVLRH